MPFAEEPHFKLRRIKHLVEVCIYMISARYADIDKFYHSCGRLIADYKIRRVVVLCKISQSLGKLFIGRKFFYPVLLIIRFKIAVVLLALTAAESKYGFFGYRIILTSHKLSQIA